MDSLAYKKKSGVIKPQTVIEMLYEVTKGEAIVTSDVGQHQMWAAQYYLFDEPRRWINSGGLGTMGFGLPAAMGAKIAMPDRDVVCVTGPRTRKSSPICRWRGLASTCSPTARRRSPASR